MRLRRVSAAADLPIVSQERRKEAMNWLSRLLGYSGSKQSQKELRSSSDTLHPLFSVKHLSAKEIAEAEQVATQAIEIKVAGSGMITSLNSTDYLQMKEILDRAVAKSPSNTDLLYARASLHYLALQGEDGQKDREQCLYLAPDHFDAKMKKDNFKSWDTLFNVPGWDEHRTTLSDLIMKYIEMDHMVQVVRDHLRGAVAVVVPENRINLNGCSRLRWELRWETTPYGKVAAHYLFLDNGQFMEMFIPHTSTPEPKINSNYWLLRRLATEKYCFIIVTRGQSVVRNVRYMFPPKLITTLEAMGTELIKSGPSASMAQCQKAAQWYMQNSDESSLRY